LKKLDVRKLVASGQPYLALHGLLGITGPVPIAGFSKLTGPTRFAVVRVR
jgi:hypothetical protein